MGVVPLQRRSDLARLMLSRTQTCSNRSLAQLLTPSALRAINFRLHPFSLEKSTATWTGRTPLANLFQRSRQLSSFEMAQNKPLRYADIGINLGDPVFRGEYHGKKAHDDDLEDVIQRALDVGCTKFMVTGSSLKESQHAVEIAKQYPGKCYATIGMHPCSTQGFDKCPHGPDALIKVLRALAVKAIPLDRLQIETDGPWCEIRASHASSQYLKDGPAVPKAVKKEKWQKGLMVKGRNEPASIVQVAHVIARVKGIPVEQVCEAAWKNSTEMFGLGTDSS